MKVALALGLVLGFGLTSIAQARDEANVKMINKTGKLCKIQVFGGENNEKTIDDTLNAGESGTAHIAWCPTKFVADCGGTKYEDKVTCAELKGDDALEVTFE